MLRIVKKENAHTSRAKRKRVLSESDRIRIFCCIFWCATLFRCLLNTNSIINIIASISMLR